VGGWADFRLPLETGGVRGREEEEEEGEERGTKETRETRETKRRGEKPTTGGRQERGDKHLTIASFGRKADQASPTGPYNQKSLAGPPNSSTKCP
jgi:hypothetical protein